MWLRLYQSASIWLVCGLSRSPTQKSIVPQVQIGLRPIASRIAAAATTMMARQRSRRGGDHGAGLAERSALAKRRPFGATQPPCCALTDPAATEASSKPKARRFPTTATWIDLEEPTRGGRGAGRALHPAWTCRPRSEMAEIEPSSRLYEQQRRALHDGQRALRRVEDGQPRTDADQLRARRQPAGDGPLRDAQAGPRIRGPCAARAATSSAMRRRRWCGCSTRSSTGSPTSSRTSAATSSRSPRTFSTSEMDERRIPAARLTALLTRIGRTQTLLTKIRYSAVSTIRMLSFLSGQPLATKTAAASFGTISPASAPTSTSLSEHASFLSDNLTFLLDASLGPDQHRAECGDEAVLAGRPWCSCRRP